MTLLEALLLSAFIAPTQSYDGSKEKAERTLALYCYKESDLDESMKRLQKKYVPEELKSLTGLAAGIYTVTVNQRIQFVWTF